MAEKTQGPGHAMFGQLEAPKQAPEPGSAAAPAAPAPGGAGPAGAAPGSPQVVYVQAPPPVVQSPPSGGVRILPALVALLFIVVAVNLYLTVTGQRAANQAMSKQADDLNLLTRRMNTSDELYSELQGKFQVTSERVGLTEKELSRARTLASDTQKQLAQSNQQLSAAISKKASAEELNKAQDDANAKIGGLSSDLAGTRKDLESALAGTKGELSGAIARTHDELVELAHRTDRDYFEFNLERKGAKQKVGSVVVELERTNPKKNQFSVYLYFDDKRAERKDKAIDEPVYFYMQGASSALELVVNKINKNGITGYVSAPKGFIANTPSVLTARPGV